ncbi:MAG: hypothetical protein QXF79_02500, partial [Ignisphaera sp.]
RKDQAPPRKRSIRADHSRRITSPNINLYKTRNSCARLKFVITDLEKDLEEVKGYAEKGIPIDRIILQPNCYTLKYEDLARYIVEKGFPYRVLPQLHKLIGLP